jgi:predicted aspartyl protease
MGLLFAYRAQPTTGPVWSLDGRAERPRPEITLAVVSPRGTEVMDGLLDTGADDTVFPDQVARRLGIDLTHAPAGTAKGVGGGSLAVRYAEVKLRISDGQEFREWTAKVGFTAAPLLGFAGCLQFFTATFHGDREEVELTVNSHYRGT